jgi:FecR protein
MSDEYLWDREGEPDAEIARLERLLEPLAHRPKKLQFEARNEPLPTKRLPWLGWAAAAAIAVVMVSLAWWVRAERLHKDSAWKVSWNGAALHRVRTGELIETGKGSDARLEADFVGEVKLDPQSRLRIVESTREQQRMLLQRGTMHAFIWAPPREFVVDTPNARTVDLGCAYTLHVNADGTGLLTVEMGWVAFEWRNLESFIPAGAACETRPGHGPGTPHFLDADADFETALARFDSGDRLALPVVLAAARPRDALTLWHLLGRTQGDERAKVFDRFSELVTLPPQTTRERIMSGDPSAMDAAWNALGLGNTDWWRGWKRQW